MNDSSFVSEIDENAELDHESDCKATDPQIAISDKIIKYLRIDVTLKRRQKEHREELKAIKQTKKDLENFIISYLDKIEQEFIEIKNQAVLTKKTYERKEPIRLEKIEDVLINKFSEDNILPDDETRKSVIKELLTKIEAERKVSTRKAIRTKMTNK